MNAKQIALIMTVLLKTLNTNFISFFSEIPKLKNGGDMESSNSNKFYFVLYTRSALAVAMQNKPSQEWINAFSLSSLCAAGPK